MSRAEAPLRPSRDLEQIVAGGRMALAETMPISTGDRISPVRHRRGDCSRMSAASKTTVVAVHPLSGSPWTVELCPCGASRELFHGRPVRRWEFRNKALDDPTWRAARQVPCNAAGGEAEVNHTDSHHRRRHLAEGPLS